MSPHIDSHDTECFMCRDCGKEYNLITELDEHYKYVLNIERLMMKGREWGFSYSFYIWGGGGNLIETLIEI